MAGLVTAALVTTGLGATSAYAADTTPPSVPGSVKTAYYGGVGVVISWSKVSASDTAGYRIYRSETKTITPGATGTVLVGSTTALTFTDNPPKTGTTYYYGVLAFDKTGNASRVSSAVSVKTTDKTAPSAPSSLKISTATGGITLSWKGSTAVPDLAGYVVSRASSKSGSYLPLSQSSVTTFLDTSAPAGATSYYRVTAVDQSNNTSSAATGSATMPKPVNATPATPSGFKASASSSTGAVQLTWSASSGATGYVIGRGTSSKGPFAPLTAAPVTGTSYADTTAPSAAEAYYQLTAVNANGSSSGATTWVYVPKDTTPPAKPGSLTLTAADSGISLSWPAVTGSADLKGYLVYRASSSTGTYTLLTAQAVSATTYTDTDAPPGATSYYHVSSLDTTGNISSAASGSALRPLSATALPPAPAGFKASGSTAGVTLSWTANATGTTTGYTVSRSTSATGPWTTLTTNPVTGTSYSDTTAPVGTSYYQLVAVNKAGSSDPATASGTVPADTTAPATPGSASAKVAATGGMTVTWAANKEADLAGYTVQKRDSSGTYQPYLPAAGGTFTATTFTDATVTEGTTAYFRIRAIDRTGNLSGYVSVTANNPMVKPAAPTGLKAVADATHGIDLTWTANKETDLAGYSIYRASSSSGTYVLLTTVPVAKAGAAPAFNDSSAPKGAASYYRITAVDLVGNVSSNSSTVSAPATTDPVAIPVDYKELYVSADGADGAFTTITAALQSIPDTNLQPTRITIAPGTYHETFEVTQPNVVLRGVTGDPSDVVVSYDKASGTPDPTGGTYGTAGSATVYVSAKNVTLQDLSVVNAFDEKAHPEITSQQAVALRVEGDRFIANHVRLTGNQDTLLADTPKPTTRIRQYYVNSFIEGDVDYLFGAADAVFDHDTLHSLDRGKSDNGAITAASTDTGSKYGFLITDSKIVSNAAAGTVHLGRPWHPSADPNAIASVVYKNTWMPAAIVSDQPWEDMATADSTGTKVNFTWQSARFDEYKSIGPGGTVNANRPQLTDSAAANATPAKYLAGSDGWNPVLPVTSTTPAMPTGLEAAADNRVVNLTWADDPSADVIGWNVYRGDAATGTLTKIASTTSPTYSDTTVSNGESYAYAVTAVTRSGLESPKTIGVNVLVQAAPLVADLTVDPNATANGTTTFSTIGAALAAAPEGTATNPTVISVAKGIYQEYLTVAKPNVILVGATGNASDVVITGNRAAGTPTGGTNPDGTPATYGTAGSATVVVTGNSVQMRDLTIENAYKEGTYANGQAVALRTTGDKLVFDDVRLLGNEDTLYANSPAATTQSRVYFHDAYIEGDVDFLFGRATAVFDHSTLKALDHGTSPNGAVTAASTDKSNKYGFLITDSRIIGTAPDGSENLGRPWQPGITQPDGTSVKDDNALAQVVVRNTWLGPVVSTTQTWTTMVNSGVTTDWHAARMFEYQNTGPGAGTSGDRPQLTDAQAVDYTAANYLAGSDGWNPLLDEAADTAPATPTGLSAGSDDKVVTLSWNDNTESDVTGYRVYRAVGTATSDNTVPVDADHLVATVAKPSYTDKSVSNGTAYAYAVVAVDAAGNASAATAPVSATPGPKPLVADLTVAADGSGDYTTLQAAVNAAPAGTAAKPTVILVKPGTYRQVVQVTKPYVTIAGTTGDPRDVVLTFDNANGTAANANTCPSVTTAATCGTSGSFTVAVTASNVTMRDLTIANTFDSSKHPEIGSYNTQAVALKATADRQVYDDVRLLGVQDTLLADSAGNITSDGTGYARQYFRDSFVEGNVDFVFGRATAVFDSVTFHATAHNGGTIFAPSTAAKNPHGYLVINSRIASDNDPGTFDLGRPWRGWTDGTYADNSRGQTTIRDTWINAGVAASQPWVDFAPDVWTDGRFTEYHNSGAGATVNANRPQLSDADAANATPQKWLAGTDGWNPVMDQATDAAPAAPAKVAAAAGDGQVSLSWDENAEADVVGYHVYRVSGTGDVPTDAAHRVDGTTLTRAGFVDSGLTNGTTYSYVVSAVDAAGHESKASATVTATPAIHVDAVVKADGSGDYPTLQAALDAAPGTKPWVVQVQPGTYTGPFTLSKANVTLVGSTGTPGDVTLTSNQASNSTGTLTVTGTGVTVKDITVQDTFAGGSSTSAPALAMTGDKVVVDHVDLQGSKRVVFADTSTYTASARQMIEDSTIEGTADLVTGRATLVIDSSTLTDTLSNTAVLTPSTASTFKGILLINSKVVTPSGVSGVLLGHPYRGWGDTYVPNSVGQAVIRDSALGAGIKATQPWGVGPAGEPWTLGRFAEYGNTGDGASVNDNRPQLSPAESVGVTVSSWLGAGTWYPTVADPATPSDVTPPAAPASLKATGADGSVTLAWSSDNDVASYRVYRATGSTVTPGPATLVRSGLTGTSFTDSGLTNGTTYAYAVVAVDAAGNTAAATVTAVPADALPPAAPTGLKAGVADGTVKLSWAANTEPDLASYAVYRDGARVASGITATSWTDTGLTNGQPYAYTVTAVDTAGNESGASVEVDPVPAPGDSTAPAVPGNLGYVLGKGSVTVTWTGVTDSDLTGYSVYRTPPGGSAVKLNTDLVSGTSFTDTTASVGTAYTYSVSATDTTGNESDRSGGLTVTPVKADVVVAADGSGDATTVAAGIALLADNSDFTAQGGRTILIKPGTYSGAISSGNRYGVTLLGATANAADTVITAPGSATATLTISGKQWALRNVTVAAVPAAVGAQATALQVKSGDKQVFDNVRFLGDKQTLLLSTANVTTFSRLYFHNSYIEGGPDVVLGRAVAVFDHSTFHVLNEPGASITDSSVDTSSPYGFLITDSTILTDGNPGSIYLGRPYGTTGKAQVVVRNTVLGAAVNTAGPWKDWDATTTWTAGRFLEYQNSGPGSVVADATKRPQLSDADAANYTAQAYLAGSDNWNPGG